MIASAILRIKQDRCGPGYGQGLGYVRVFHIYGAQRIDFILVSLSFALRRHAVFLFQNNQVNLDFKEHYLLDRIQ